jgi:hypothetical protein
MRKQSTKPTKIKTTEWSIGQPLNFPPKREIKDAPSQPDKTLETKRKSTR